MVHTTFHKASKRFLPELLRRVLFIWMRSHGLDARSSGWKLEGPEAYVARRIHGNFAFLQAKCRPCIVSAYFRAVWNGWPTSVRMRHMQRNSACCTCKFGCKGAYDSLEHYARCKVVWTFFSAPVPSGLGIGRKYKSVDGFLLAQKGMAERDKVAIALGIYSVSKTLMQVQQANGDVNFQKLFRLHAKAGMRGSGAYRILKRT